MSKKPKIKLDWEGDDWNESIDEYIEQHINKIKNDIIANTGLTEKTEIHALIIDISIALRLTYNYFKEINRAGSDAVIYNTLKHFKENSQILIDNYRTCDSFTRNLIAKHYPKGWMDLEAEAPDPNLLMQAVNAAINTIPKPKPGRPSNTRNEAQHVLAEKLADAYACHVGKPYRNVDRITGEESGAYHDFVELVIPILPQEVLTARNGIAPSVDHIVRLSVDYINRRTAPYPIIQPKQP